MMEFHKTPYPRAGKTGSVDYLPVDKTFSRSGGLCKKHKKWREMKVVKFCNSSSEKREVWKLGRVRVKLTKCFMRSGCRDIDCRNLGMQKVVSCARILLAVRPGQGSTETFPNKSGPAMLNPSLSNRTGRSNTSSRTEVEQTTCED